MGQGARGRNGELIPVSVAVGDRVLLPEYGGQPVADESKDEFVLFRGEEILAKIAKK